MRPARGLRRDIEQRDDRIHDLESTKKDLEIVNETLSARLRACEAELATIKNPQKKLEKALSCDFDTFRKACRAFQDSITLAISSLRNTAVERHYLSNKFVENPCRELSVLYRTALGCSSRDDWDALSLTVNRSNSVNAWDVLTSIVGAKTDHILSGPDESYGFAISFRPDARQRRLPQCSIGEDR